MSKIQKLQDELGTWSDEIFGDHKDPIGCINHMKEECNELLQEPYNMMEYADVLHLLLDAVRRSGYNTTDLLDFAFIKLEVNKGREWEEPDEYGIVRHKK